MDSFELNKMAGAVLAALLTIFGVKTLMDIGLKPHKLEKPAYEVAVTEESHGGGHAGAGAAAALTQIPIAELLKAGTVDNGKDVFKKCAACHTPDKGGATKVGPNLFGVVGHEVGKHPGFAYSDPMKGKGGTWTFDALRDYIYDPKGTVPGNKMAFAGVKDKEDLASVILYLRTLSDAPVALPQ